MQDLELYLWWRNFTELTDYSSSAPAHQNAFDLFKGGWRTKVPGDLADTGGVKNVFETDERVALTKKVLGSYEGKHILEIGPFEGYQTAQLEKEGADVFAVENSTANFIKCLVMKNALGLKSTFALGDFNEFEAESKFDIVWFSGVLYHMTDPLSSLAKISRWADTLFIWTQYFSEEFAAENSKAYSDFFKPEKDKTVEFLGREIKHNYRAYLAPQRNGTFSGGSESFSYWLSLDDIKFALEAYGFKINMILNNPKHPTGPACYFVARRD
nr:methyltransferase domain-containing protein [uncultured Cohaesibacter sp.]